MADLKITSLPALAEAGIQATDVLALADLSATETKKVTVKDLVAAAVVLLDAGDIPAAKVGTLGSNQVAGSAIQDGAITNAKLANSSISLGGISIALGATDATPAFNLADATGYTTANLSGTISNAQLTGSITGDKLSNTTVTYAKLNLTDGDIPAAKITGNSITNAQIGADAVGSSELAANAVDTNAIANSAVTNAKLANANISLGGLTLALGSTDATPALDLSDATNYPTTSLSGTITNTQLAGSITGDKLANTTIAYGKLNLADGSVPGAKITGNSITAAQIGANAVSASELADDAVDTAAVVDAAITGVKIATDTITAGNIAANAVGASELANNAVDTAAVVDGAITTDKIADGAITTAKLDGTIAASSIADNSVTSAKIAANAVGASELADNSVDTDAIQNSAITDIKISAVSGGKILNGSIDAAALDTTKIDRSLNVASGKLGINNTITAATRSGITYNAQGLITASAALGASDLPIATVSAVGGVSVGTGLSVSGAGALSLSNSVTGSTVSGITFNNQGQITAATALTSAMLPVATTSAKGAVQITSGGGLTVDGAGNLITSTSGVSAGTYQSVTVNDKGAVTAGAALSAALVPSLPASKITTGSFDAARIANDSIDGTKLSNASTAIFQSIAQSGYPTAQFSGQILFDTVSEDAFIWDGNAWQAITTLTKGSLVFGGTYNASTSKMASTTTAGIAAGLAVGSNLPTPSATTDGLYVVVDVAGTPSSPAPVVAFSPPDYILGVTNSTGSSWNEIDLSQTVAGQVASNITFTPYGQISSTNVQDAMQELETEKMSFGGGTVTGQLLIGNTGSFAFEGSTVDAYELTLAVSDPQGSDKTITFPDVTGTVVTTGDTGSVTGAMLANDTIQNVDIKSDAAIAFSKLAALNSAQILVGNGSNVATAVAVTGDIGINNAGLTSIAAGVIVNADISGSAAIAGSKISTGTTSAVGVLQLTDSTSSTSATTAATPNAVKSAYDLANTANTTSNAALPLAGGILTGNLIIDDEKELRFNEEDANGSNYIGFKAPASLSSDITFVLPVDGSTNQALVTDGSGNLSFSSNFSGTAATATLATSFTVTANNSTDETVYPLFADGATGSQGAETDTGLTYNPSSGLLTSTGFAGALTGNVTGNVTGNITGNVTGNITGNVTGDVTGDLTGDVTGDVTGALTGAASQIKVLAESVEANCYPIFIKTNHTGDKEPKSSTSFFFNSSNGQLNATSFVGSLNATNLASGTVNVARLGSGSSVSTKFLRGDNTWQTISSTPEGTAILSTGESGATKFLREDGDGTCSWQLITGFIPSGGGSFTGDVTFTGTSSNLVWYRSTFSGLDDVLNFKNDTTASFGDSHDLKIYSDGSRGYIQFPAAGGLHVGNTTTTNILDIQPTQLAFNVDTLIQDKDFDFRAGGVSRILYDQSDLALEFNDDVKATFGAGSDLNIYSDGTQGVFDGDIQFTGASKNIEWDKSANDLIFKATGGVSGKAHWGAGGSSYANLQIYMDTSGAIVSTSHARLQLSAYNSQDILISSSKNIDFINNTGTTNYYMRCLEKSGSDQCVELYYGNTPTKRLETTSTGVAVSGGLTVSGDLTVSGTTTTVNSTELSVTDKNITMGNVGSPSDTTADGGGLTLKGTSDKTFNWVDSTDAWTSSEHIQVASGKTFIGNGSTLTALNASNLGSGTIPDARFPSTLPAVSGANLTNVNATTLDSIDSGSFLRSDANDSMSGVLNLTSSTNEKLILSGSSTPVIRFQEGTTNKAQFQWSSDGNIYIWNDEHNRGLQLGSTPKWYDGSAYQTIWHQGNDGSGSGLDADTLDGLQASSFVRTDAGSSMSGNLTLTSAGQYPLNINGGNDGKIVLQGSSSPYMYFREGTTDKAYLQWTTNGLFTIYNSEQGKGLALGSTLTWDGGTVVTSANVGSGGVLSSSAVYVNDLYASNWFRNTASNEGIYNEVNSNHFYSDGAQTWALAYNGASGGLTIRDGHNGNAKGYLWATDNNEIGLLNMNGGWSIRCNSSSQSAFYGTAYPSASNSHDLGTSSYKWKDGYFHGTVNDGKGSLRSIPQNYRTSAYTLVASDAGKHIYYSGGAAAITVPTNTFSVGDAITVISANSSTDITIAQGSGVTIYFANDGSTGTRTLASKGMCTLICVSGTNTFSISGSGLT